MTVLSLNIAADKDHSSDSVTELFHRLNRVLPDDQDVLKISPDETVGSAFQIMKDKGFSQLPVVEGREVLGIFSYRSFSAKILKLQKIRCSIDEMPVDDFIEKLHFAHISDEFGAVLTHLDRDGAVLVGEPDHLQGILTVMDVLHYLYGVASPFVMVSEIELAIRGLIFISVDAEQLADCARSSLHSIYNKDKLPTELHQMSFNDYIQIVSHGENWEYFKPLFGGMRETVRAKLTEVRDLRNDIFHFKRELTISDHEILADNRDWALRKARIADARQKGVK